MALARFKARFEPGDDPQVELDGVALPAGVVFAGIALRPGDPVPRLYLEAPVGAVVEGEGIVEVRVDTSDTAAVLRAFLANVDPDELERQALAQYETIAGADMTTGQSFLAALAAMVEP